MALGDPNSFVFSTLLFNKVLLTVILILSATILSCDSFNPYMHIYNQLFGNQIELEFPEVFNFSKHLKVEFNQNDTHEVLGPVIKLHTFSSPQDVKKIEAKMSICNRNMQTYDINFKIDQHRFGHNKDLYPLDLVKMNSSGFNPDLRTVIIVPGFMSGDIQTEPWIDSLKETWLKLEDMNVITVSWQANNRYRYTRAVANTPFVGRQITIFLYYLASLTGTSLLDENFLRRIHFVGHSLGAHISGFVGKDLNGKIGRITALDPAGPSFDSYSPDLRLNSTDALLVECFHTNAGRMRYLNFGGSTLIKGVEIFAKNIPLVSRLAHKMESRYSGEGNTAWYGILEPIGHIDYYVNDGRTQPGCIGLMHVCDHQRAYQVFESFLNYELYLKNSGNRNKEDRFIAFRASDASGFAVGLSFNDNCPELLAGNSGLRLQSKTIISRNFKACSLPIDLTSDIIELREELSQDYGIDLNNGSANARYYFKTRHEAPYVGDHYMLKLGFASEPDWTDGCLLKAVIKTRAQQTTEIKLNKQFDIIRRNNTKKSLNYRGLAIPFIHPNGPDAHKTLVDMYDHIKRYSIGNKLHNSSESEIRSQVPEYITLDVERHETTGIMETMMDWFRFSYKDKCKLEINYIEIQPITPSEHTFVARYMPANTIPSSESPRLFIFENKSLNRMLLQRRNKNNTMGVIILQRDSGITVKLSEVLLV